MPAVANPRLLISLGCYGSVGLASFDRPKEQKTLLDYRQSAGLTIAPSSPMKKDSGGCVRSMASSKALSKQEEKSEKTDR